MPPIYIREQGAHVRKSGETIYVTLREQKIFSIPLANTEQVILMGNVQITTQAALFLVRNGIDLIFMTQTGSSPVTLTNRDSRQAARRFLQYKLCEDESRALDVARSIVIGKIGNQRVMLQRRAREDGRIRQLVAGMANMAEGAASAATLDQLRGYEGKAAAFYFEGMRSMFPAEWNFRERIFHPPPDEPNALLSFLYTMLRKDVEIQIRVAGLDPYLGFFHALGPDKPGLALDLMEEFRPIIADSVAMNLVQRKQITVEDFDRTNIPTQPVRMSPPAMARVVEAYEERMAEKVYHPLAGGQTDYRSAIQHQVFQMVHVLEKGESYKSLDSR